MTKLDQLLASCLTVIALSGIAIVTAGSFIYDHGHKDGYSSGYTKGGYDGYELGYDAAYKKGLDDGYEASVDMVADSIKRAKDRCYNHTYNTSTITYGNNQAEEFEIYCGETAP